ncbi:MAG: serine hydrolase [SAR202 cluster bacterium]|nr:serine hydrolase [SAR202 cluster bacterium]
MGTSTLPSWVTWPGDDWQQITPEEAGLDPARFKAFLDGLDVRPGSFGGEDHSGNRYGAVITRGGYLVHSWGDRHYRYQTASVGKALSWPLIGFAVEDGLLDADQPINRYWTGDGELSHPHKHLDKGFHKNLTWRHIIGHKHGAVHHGGFPMEVGNRWREKRTGLEEPNVVDGVVEWARWTGDPFYDLYSHAEPGTLGVYSSAGFWRLGQALTHVWDRDLKDVIDERLFSKIGIPADRWDWLTGEYVHKQKYLYPKLPDTYTYLDPPYRVKGHVVRSGPGWVVISASDWARVGHLIACGGVWNGKQIIDPQWLRTHSGGNKCGMYGEGDHFTAMGVVTTAGLEYPYKSVGKSFIPEEVFTGPVRVKARR